MAKLRSKLGEWELPHVHTWRERTRHIGRERVPLVFEDTRVATLGSCFAEELAAAMTRLGLHGAMHPTGLLYNTRSIRQELDRAAGRWPANDEETAWPVRGGFVHPFKSYHRVFDTREALDRWSSSLDRQAAELLHSAQVVVITLGLIEAWYNPATGLVYRQIPHPEVFPHLEARMRRLTVAEMLDDLEAIRSSVRDDFGAELVLTVSPVPLDATMTPLDIRVANTESKSRIRAAVSEFIDRHPDVHYFHSYEIVTTAERQSEFMLEDGRHVRRRAVDYIIQQFLATFASESISVPEVDVSWLSAPSQLAARPRQPSRIRRWARRAVGILRARSQR